METPKSRILALNISGFSSYSEMCYVPCELSTFNFFMVSCTAFALGGLPKSVSNCYRLNPNVSSQIEDTTFEGSFSWLWIATDSKTHPLHSDMMVNLENPFFETTVVSYTDVNSIWSPHVAVKGTPGTTLFPPQRWQATLFHNCAVLARDLPQKKEQATHCFPGLTVMGFPES